MKIKGERVLVTGGAGFIGSHLVDRLISEGLEVTALDNLFTGSIENISSHIGVKGFQFIKGDIRDVELVRRLVKDVDVIFHLAAIVSVPLSMKDPLLSNDVNLKGTLNLLEACREADLKRVIFTSSCAVYGNSQVSPQREELPVSPLSPYAAGKASAEVYCRTFHEVHGLETVSLRLFNVYGPRQRGGDYSGVITRFVDRLARGEPPIIYGDGEQTRDFVYVDDVVEAHILASSSEGVVGKAINVGTGYATTVNQLAEVIKEVMEVEAPAPIHAESKAGEVRHSCADITNAGRVMEYLPRFSLRDGLRRMLERG